MTTRSYEIGDVVARGEDVGIVTGAEPYADLRVMTLPDGGPKRLWAADTVRLIMTTEALASVLRSARDDDADADYADCADDTGA
jgi:hypothetical protein